MEREAEEMFEALLDLTGVLNRPQPDQELLALAGVGLERALLPLLVRVHRRGPLGVKELADLCGRDHTTVSRQVARLTELGLVARSKNERDARVKEVSVTEKGRTVSRALDRAREKRLAAVLADWKQDELGTLVKLLRRLADDAIRFTRAKPD